MSRRGNGATPPPGLLSRFPAAYPTAIDRKQSLEGANPKLYPGVWVAIEADSREAPETYI